MVGEQVEDGSEAANGAIGNRSSKPPRNPGKIGGENTNHNKARQSGFQRSRHHLFGGAAALLASSARKRACSACEVRSMNG